MKLEFERLYNKDFKSKEFQNMIYQLHKEKRFEYDEFWQRHEYDVDKKLLGQNLKIRLENQKIYKEMMESGKVVIDA